jgi:hypothetical protein
VGRKEEGRAGGRKGGREGGRKEGRAGEEKGTGREGLTASEREESFLSAWRRDLFHETFRLGGGEEKEGEEAKGGRREGRLSAGRSIERKAPRVQREGGDKATKKS